MRFHSRNTVRLTLCTNLTWLRVLRIPLCVPLVLQNPLLLRQYTGQLCVSSCGLHVLNHAIYCAASMQMVSAYHHFSVPQSCVLTWTVCTLHGDGCWPVITWIGLIGLAVLVHLCRRQWSCCVMGKCICPFFDLRCRDVCMPTHPSVLRDKCWATVRVFWNLITNTMSVASITPSLFLFWNVNNFGLVRSKLLFLGVETLVEPLLRYVELQYKIWKKVIIMERLSTAFWRDNVFLRGVHLELDYCAPSSAHRDSRTVIHDVTAGAVTIATMY